MGFSEILDFRARVGATGDQRTELQKHMDRAAAEERAEQRDLERRQEQAAARREASAVAMHAAGVSYADVSRAQHEVSAAAERVQELESELERAERVLRGRRGAYRAVMERSADAAGMASRAEVTTEPALQRAGWALGAEMAAEAAMEAHVARVQRRMVDDSYAKLMDAQAGEARRSQHYDGGEITRVCEGGQMDRFF